MDYKQVPGDKRIDMENETSSIESLWDKARNYIETRIDLLRLKAIDKASSVVAAIITQIVLIIVLTLFVIMLNIGVALWIGSIIGSSYCGFFIVAAFYAITGLVLFLGRKKWLKGPISSMMIKNLMD